MPPPACLRYRSFHIFYLLYLLGAEVMELFGRCTGMALVRFMYDVIPIWMTRSKHRKGYK